MRSGFATQSAKSQLSGHTRGECKRSTFHCVTGNGMQMVNLLPANQNRERDP